MERGELRALYVIGENPAQSEADAKHTRELLAGLDHLVVQDIFLTKTAELADVVLPAARLAGARPRARSRTASGACSACARRSTRPARRATTSWIIARARPAAGPRLGHADGRGGLGRAALAVADARRHELRAARGARRHPVAVPGRASTRARRSCTRGSGPSRSRARRRRSRVVEHEPPVEALDAEFPIRLTTGRRLESYNTGVQTTATPRRCTAASRSTSRPRTPSGSARGGRARAGRPRGAARSRRRCASTARCGRAWRS